MGVKLFLVVALVGILAACAATPTGLRQGKPDLDEVTNIPAERLAGCIGDKIEVAANLALRTRFSSRPTTNGYSISAEQASYGGATDTIILVDITRLDSNKTHIQLYTHFLGGDGAQLRGLLENVSNPTFPR